LALRIAAGKCNVAGIMGGIIWLASYPKSGNTWTRVFLHNFIWQKNEAQDINAMGKLTSTDNAPQWYRPYIDKPQEQWTHADIAAARPLAHKLIHDTAEGFIFLKTHSALVSHLGVPLITAQYTAAAIYVVRNPLDVAISYAHHLDASIDEAIETMAEDGRWIDSHERGVYQIMGSWSENVETWTRSQRPSLLVMRYEDMLAKPTQTFARLVQWLSLPPDPDRLKRALDRSSFSALKQQEQEKGYIERPKNARSFFREGKAGQWRETLSPAQVARLVARHGPQMDRFGYLKPAHAFLRSRGFAVPVSRSENQSQRR
jgi:hypothetical protein